MQFLKYQHLERLGTPEVEGIEIGTCHIQPKLDGTNGSVWWCDGLKAASRNRILTPDSDNQGFLYECLLNNSLISATRSLPNHVFYGEWLVPHTLKTYRDEAWRRFYVFDVVHIVEGEIKRYEEPDSYIPILQRYNVDYVPTIAVIENPSIEQLRGMLDKNTFMMRQGEVGEGIVIKNYSYVNRWGRCTWAKMVRNEFKEKHIEAMGPPVLKGESTVEIEVATTYVTEALVRKELAKIVALGEDKPIQPRLLSTVFHAIITEETWNILSKFKNPTIDFKLLQKHVYAKVKAFAPEYF